MRKTLIFTAMSLFFLMFGSCKKEQTEETIPDNDTIRSHPAEKIDSLAIKAQDSIARQDSLQLVKKKRADKYAVYNGEEYMSWPIKVSDSLRKAFYKKYSKEEIYIIAALNRIDTDNINRRDTIIVPKEVRTDIMSYSPFPHELSILDSIPKIAVFSYPIQAYALYEKGVLVKWGPTNMGKKTAQTPRGLFFTNWKGRKIKSTANDEWILNWNFNISNSGGVGWHQYALPGYPASHSCLRLLDADAQWMYNWADQWVLENKNTVKVKGTPVIVYGDYAFGKKGIWNDLVKNPQATAISVSQMNEVISKHLPEIMKQQKIRELYNEEKQLQKSDKKQTETANVPKDSL